jgi:hypothetical protein
MLAVLVEGTPTVPVNQLGDIESDPRGQGLTVVIELDFFIPVQVGGR